MMHLHPMIWTAVHLALTGAATWLLLETEALQGSAILLFH